MLTPEDHVRVADAIRTAEAHTDGEIAVVVAPESDSYADVVLHWALLLALLPLALFASFPALLERLSTLIHGPWSESAPPLWLLLSLVLAATVIAFLIGRYLFAVPSIRRALIPSATSTRRARRRAIMLFQVGTERRTASRTGVLLYLSLAEHHAEIVADQSIQSRIGGEEWGEAMAALLEGMRDGRPGDGLVAAVGRIGAVLATHYPFTGGDPNELPDRLIEL